MSEYVLDTDILTLFQDGHSSVSRRVLSCPAAAVATTVLTVEEQLSGWYSQVRKAKKPEKLLWAYRRLAENTRFLAGLRILDFDEAALRLYEELKRNKVKLGRTDLRIAAIVLSRGATLVTRNLGDFSKIPGLSIEDWSK